MRYNRIIKELSPNDAGETASHQAGMLIPKKPALLEFFPRLEVSVLNPRVHLEFEDASGCKWNFAFIYYNNKFFGKTRNEYRLTHMTRYIKRHNLVSGDEIELLKNDDESYGVSHSRRRQAGKNSADVLVLGSGWKIINLK